MEDQNVDVTSQDVQKELTPQEYVDHVIMLEMKVRELKALVEYDDYLNKFQELQHKKQVTNE